MDNIVSEFNNYGVILIQRNMLGLTDEDLLKLDILANSDKLGFEEYKDKQGAGMIKVLKLLYRPPGSRLIHSKTHLFLDLIESDKLAKFYRQLGQDLFIYRCQINEVINNGFIYEHRDGDEDPSTLLTCIVKMNGQHSGGDFIANGQRHNLQPGDMLVINPDVPHHVERTIGTRRTLVFFLTSESKLKECQGKNPKAIDYSSPI